MADKYPEHEKMAKVTADSHRLGEFIDWMEAKGYLFAQWMEADTYRVRDPESGELKDRSEERLVPVHKTINEWLAAFYEIDLNKIEEEKRQMLDDIRQANETARAIDEQARA